MWRHNLPRETIAGLGCGISEDRCRLQDPVRFQRNEVRVAGTDSDAVQRAAHGFMLEYCVTVMAGRQPVKRPTGSARSTEMRESSPP